MMRPASAAHAAAYRPSMTCRIPLLLAALALAAAVPSHAHDTWFAPQGANQLTLGTGNRFPVTELAVDDKYFARRGCIAADGTPRSLDKQRFADTATHLRTAPGAAACFVQLDAFDVELADDKIALYFKEIRPPQAVLDAWQQMRGRGLPFRERYIKSARIELDAAAAARPVGTVMDAVRLAPAGAPTVGSEAEFQVLRDGKPLADFNVELVNERSPIGLWHRTDAQGRIRARLPLPGRWVLRGTDLRVAAGDATRWESWFVTYAFEVAR
jgi:hypothetical protein